MEEQRLRALNNRPVTGKCVVYVMSRDQRVRDNHALVVAQQTAEKLRLPLAVVFCLKPKAGFRSREHYMWMIQGLRHVEADLHRLNIPFMMLVGEPSDTLAGMLHHTQPAAVYFDQNPLRGPRSLQTKIARSARCAVYVVDTHNIVPVWHASPKQEYAARTLRPKIQKQLAVFLREPSRLYRHGHSWPGLVRTIDSLNDLVDSTVSLLPASGQSLQQTSGEKAAADALDLFIGARLKGYATQRNDPLGDGQSELSPHLHFGQLSALRVALEVNKAVIDNLVPQADAEVFLEEIIVRKELSDNFCYYNQQYDSLEGAPDWARKTLQKHLADSREFVYTYEQFDGAKTHDPAWNAAQKQLTKTGKMHGYMRMYWAKKVLEWSPNPKDAIDTLIRLNDFYSIDGGDPNGYAGILWSVAGLHDRPWFERSIFGTVRYMNYNGLKRKFNLEEYIKRNDEA